MRKVSSWGHFRLERNKRAAQRIRMWRQKFISGCHWESWRSSWHVCEDTLPQSPFPGLSLSDLQLPAVPVVGEVAHDNEDADDDDEGGAGCFVVHSANTTPELDGRWDGHGFSHKHTLRDRNWDRREWGLWCIYSFYIKSNFFKLLFKPRSTH